MSRVKRILNSNPNQRGVGFAWGFGDQAMSSFRNFLLVLIVGRWLGVESLGVVSVGFSAYLVLLVAQRALLLDPLVVLPGTERDQGEGSTVTMSVVSALVAGLLLAITGWIVGGSIGRGFLLFAPWVAPALLQDVWRFMLFSARRGRSAALNDAAWVTAMTLCVLLALGFKSDWSLVSAWGLGATVGSILGFGQTRVAPRGLGRAISWWRGHAYPLGGWFALDQATSLGAIQAANLFVAGLLGASSLGGLRAIQSIYAPVTLLGPSVYLPGLPAVRDALRVSVESARKLSLRLGTLLLLSAAIYLFVLGVWGGFLIDLIFGESFVRFSNLILPVAFAQLGTAAAVAPILVLKAARDGVSLFRGHAISSIILLASVALLAQTGGLGPAAWGLAVGSWTEALALFIWAYFGAARYAGASSERAAPTSAGKDH